MSLVDVKLTKKESEGLDKVISSLEVISEAEELVGSERLKKALINLVDGVNETGIDLKTALIEETHRDGSVTVKRN